MDRLRGYRLTMAKAGLSDSGLIVFGDFGRVSAEHAVYRLLDRRPRLDAVFVASDLMAAGALRAVRRSDRRVPGDVAVICLRGLAPGAAYRPEADHRAPAGGGHGRAVRERTAGADRPAGQDPMHVVLDTELVIRESA